MSEGASANPALHLSSKLLAAITLKPHFRHGRDHELRSSLVHRLRQPKEIR